MSRAEGDIAEEEAARYLETLGFEIVERNYFARVGEIDIIAKEGDVICFIEVKERSYGSFGGALAAITQSKLWKILKSARRYLYENDLLDANWRIDALLIEGKAAPELIRNIYTEGM